MAQDLTQLYSAAENAQLATLQTAYNNAMSALQAEATKNAAAKSSHTTIPTPQVGLVYWSNPVVDGGAHKTIQQYQNWLTASDNLITFLTNDAAAKKIALDDYNASLNDKYTLAFANANPDVVTQTAASAAQTAQAVATQEVAQSKTAVTQADADAAKRKQNIIVFSVIGAVVIIGTLIYFLVKKKD